MDVALRLRTVGSVSEAAAAPLLVVLDGPDYVRRARLLSVLRGQVETGRLPSHRLALVSAADRFEAFSASPRYGRGLLAALDELGRARRVGVGSSLGALALLHAHVAAPGQFSALFLQSGSFFRARTDPQERRFPRFARISRFVHAARGTPIAVTMTCGVEEENLANNRLMRDTLRAQGYDVRLHELAGGHDWDAWRGGVNPHLLELVARAAA